MTATVIADFRALLFLLFQAVVTPIYAAVFLLFCWLPRIPRYLIARNWCRVNLLAARWICGIRWRVIGRENIPASPPIVMSKHSSTFETLALNLYFPPLSFVAKKELLSIPFFGWGFALASPITIDRQAGHDAMQQMIRQGHARLAQGFWIVIYQEGTRIRVGTRDRYNTGGARLAIGLPAPVLPIAHNAGYLWPKGLFGKKPGTITLSIGPSMSPDGKDAAQLTEEVEAWIEGEVARLGAPA